MESQACLNGLALVPGPELEYTGRADNRVFLENGDGFHDYSCPGVIACIGLLVGGWRMALADASNEAPTAWSENSQGLVIPVLLAWLAGWPARSTPPSVTAPFDQAMTFLDGPDETTSGTGARYRQALTESARTWEMRISRQLPLKPNCRWPHLTATWTNSQTCSGSSPRHKASDPKGSAGSLRLTEMQRPIERPLRLW